MADATTEEPATDEPANKQLRRVAAKLDKLEHAVSQLAQVTAGSDTVVAVDYQAADILIHTNGRRERRRAFACRKEPWTVEWLEQLPAEGVLWDIGANVGAYSLIAALRPESQLQVVSVEPSFSTYAALCRNIVLNEAAGQVTPLGVMLSDKTGLQTFSYSTLEAGAAYHAGGAPTLKEGFVSAWDQQVLAYRLDELVEELGLPAPDFIKLDVDGAEVRVLHGAERVLGGVRSVMVEVADTELASVGSLMDAHGLVAVGEPDRRDGADFSYVLYER